MSISLSKVLSLLILSTILSFSYGCNNQAYLPTGETQFENPDPHASFIDFKEKDSYKGHIIFKVVKFNNGTYDYELLMDETVEDCDGLNLLKHMVDDVQSSTCQPKINKKPKTREERG